MERDSNQTQSSSTAEKLILILTVVLIFCGGNGLGILLGVVLWTRLHSKLISIGVMLGITVVAFLLAMIVVLFYLRNIKQKYKEVPRQEGSQFTNKGSDCE